MRQRGAETQSESQGHEELCIGCCPIHLRQARRWGEGQEALESVTLLCNPRPLRKLLEFVFLLTGPWVLEMVDSCKQLRTAAVPCMVSTVKLGDSDRSSFTLSY